MLFNNLKQYIVRIFLMFLLCFVCANPYLYDSVCPKGPDGSTPGGSIYGGYWNAEDEYFVDKWGFAQCNCTSYAANRVNMNGIAFNNSSFGTSIGVMVIIGLPLLKQRIFQLMSHQQRGAWRSGTLANPVGTRNMAMLPMLNRSSRMKMVLFGP